MTSVKNATTPKLFVATKAFIAYEGKVLIIHESGHYQDGSNAGRFDVVGGRLEPGQHFRDSLMREIREETGLNVEIGKPFFVNEWRPNVRKETWQIIGIFFSCNAKADIVRLSSDHDNYQWINPKEYKSKNIIENLYPAFEAYLETLT